MLIDGTSRETRNPIPDYEYDYEHGGGKRASSLEPRLRITITVTNYEYDYELRVRLRARGIGNEPLASSLEPRLRSRLRARARADGRQAGGTASGSERREGPAAMTGRRRDAIPSRWRQCSACIVAWRFRWREMVGALAGRAFKRQGQRGWAPGIRLGERAFAPLAAARGTSTLPTGGSCQGKANG